MRGQRRLTVLMALAIGVSACGGGTSTSTPGGSVAASAPALPGATTRCKAASADLSKTTVGPNGEPSTSASDIPDLTADQLAKVQAAHYKWAWLPSDPGTWFSAVGAGAKDEAAKLGLQLTVTAESAFDAAKQASDVETAMASKPDIILALPNDPSSAAQAFKPAVDAGVKLVFNDNGVNGYTAGKEYVSIVSGDHYGMGAAAADLMVKALGDKGGKIGVIYHDADFYVTNNRDCRFLATIQQKHPEIQIVAESGFTDQGATDQVASAMLTQHPDLNGIYVAWSAAATGVIASLRAAGRPDIKVVAVDLDATNDVDMAKSGNLYGVSADRPFLIGQTQIKLAVLSLLGEKEPGFVTVPVVTETKETIQQAWRDSLNSVPPSEVLKALGQ